MKKLVINVFAMLMILTASASHLSAIPNVKIVKDEGEKSMILQFRNSGALPTQIRILDEKGTEIWRNNLEGENVSAIKYNFKKLPEGRYDLYIGNELSVTIQPIEITNSEIKWDVSHQREVFHPVTKLEGKKLDFSMLTLGNKVQVKLLDAQSNVLYNENFADVNHIEKRFDLNKLEKGNYLFVVHTQGEQILKEFNLQ